MEVIIYQVDAFTDKAFGGNPAGVVPDARGLSEKDMQDIAAEMNLSETAFVLPKSKNKYEVRFFTPKCEVDLCGHATIASFYTLAKKRYIEGLEDGIIKIHQQTRVGELQVDIHYLGGEVEKVMMYQGTPRKIQTTINMDMLCKGIGVTKSEIGLDGFNLEPEVITTGLPDIILPIKSKSILDNLETELNMISVVSEKSKAIGVHAFTIDDEGVIYCRNFAPLVGINEEAATGTANGALAYYLKKNNIVSGSNISMKQGVSLGRPSTIECQLNEVDDNYIVKVGGKAIIVMEGVISI